MIVVLALVPGSKFRGGDGCEFSYVHAGCIQRCSYVAGTSMYYVIFHSRNVLLF